MNKGKDICRELKAVRKRIAEENGIDLEIPECTYHGPCKGTCPRCEREVRYLENALAQKIRMGKVATVAGLALTLGVSGSAAAQSENCRQDAGAPSSHERQTDECEVTGVVVDAKTREPLPFVSVMLYKDTAKAMVVQTDFDGRYRFSVPRGRYTLATQCTGYSEYRREVKVHRAKEQCVMELTYDNTKYDIKTPKVDTVELEAAFTGLVAVTYDTRGTVIDSKTKEELPFVNIIVKKDGKPVNGTSTDFDGNFKITLEEGEYEFLISYVGYAQKRFPVKVPGDMSLKAIELESTVELLDEGIIIESEAVPLMDQTTPGQNSEMKIEGVPLRIQY